MKIISIVFFIVLVASVYGIYYFTDIQQRGMHNIDLIFNLVKDNDICWNGFDKTQEGKIISYCDLYIAGTNMVDKGFIFFGVSCFLIGFISNELLKKKK